MSALRIPPLGTQPPCCEKPRSHGEVTCRFSPAEFSHQLLGMYVNKIPLMSQLTRHRMIAALGDIAEKKNPQLITVKPRNGDTE